MLISSTKGIGVDALKILVYGESGAGKTSLAKTIGEPTLLISAEAGLLPLRGESIDVIDLTRADDGSVIPKEKRIAKLLDVYQFLQSDECKKKYKTIFIDSLSEINSNMLEQLQQEMPDAKETLKMYGELAKRMRSLIKAFRDLPHYSIVFTCLSEIDKDENNQRFVAPQLIGKLSGQIAAFLDEVYFIHVNKETGERVLLTNKTDNIIAKDRSNSLNKNEPADLGAIYAKIRKVEKDKELAVPSKQSREG